MDKKTDVQTNTLKNSEDVIAKIVEIAVKNIDGVTDLKKSKIKFDHLFSKSEPGSAIDIHSKDGGVEITINIVVSYACKVKQIAERIQKKIKDDIQNMTGIAVTRVNVIVDGISFDDIGSEG